MAENSSPEKKKKEHSIYRMLVMNDETLEEIVSYRLTRMNIYLLGSSVAVLLVTIVVLAVFFTPIKYYVPGYGDYNTRSKLMKYSDAIDSLERVMKAWEVRDRSMGMLITDDMTKLDTKDKYRPDTSQTEYYDPSQIPMESDSLQFVIEKARMDERPDVKVNNVGNMFDPSTMNFSLPLTATSIVSGAYQPDKGHYGIDIADKENTPIKAVLNGIVIAASWSFDSGYVIGIQHKNGFVSFYKHNSKILKKVGDFVKAGEAIAIIGNTGNHSSGPHLHFELWYNASPVNPKDYIKMK